MGLLGFMRFNWVFRFFWGFLGALKGVVGSSAGCSTRCVGSSSWGCVAVIRDALDPRP